MAATRVKRTDKVKATGLCGVVRKGRPPCRQKAGAGTPNSKGPCWLHMGAMPTVARRYAREEAVERARAMLTTDVPDDPLEAMLASVHVASALVAYHRLKIDNLDVVSTEDVEALERANLNRKTIAEGVVRAGVAERTVQIAERMAEQITLAFEEALAGERLDRALRARLVERFAQGLVKIENRPLALPPGD